MRLSLRTVVTGTFRVALAGMCCLGIWLAWKAEKADLLFQQDTLQSIGAAIRLEPDDWKFYMRQAQLDPDDTPRLLATAVHLDPYNAQADVELALAYENQENYPRAENFLQDAYKVDNTYLPRWSLANYYLRRDNMPAFWSWAAKAAQMPAPDISNLFELCWRVSPNADQIADAIVNDNPDVLRQYLYFLFGKNQTLAIAKIAPRLVMSGEVEKDRPLLFQALNRLVAAGDEMGAESVRRTLSDRGWVIADATQPNNGDFSRVPLAFAFDWTLPSYSGLHSWPGSSGLVTEFSGIEPEECTIAEQTLLLAPGPYRFDFKYHSTDIAAGTGIRWHIFDPKHEADIATSQDLSSDAATDSSFIFSVPKGSYLLRLRLAYHRALGTPRVSGSLFISSTRIEARATL